MLDISKKIYNLLTGSTISGYTTGVYNLVLEEKTPLPCIVFERKSDFEYSKDSISMITTTLDITILSKKYYETIDIAEAVNNVLINYRDETIRKIYLDSIEETFANPAYIQKMIFTIKG
jgi:hypothetical protein